MAFRLVLAVLPELQVRLELVVVSVRLEQEQQAPEQQAPVPVGASGRLEPQALQEQLVPVSERVQRLLGRRERRR